MDTNNRPRGHERKVAGTGSVNKKGSGLGLGKPAGNTGGLSGRPGGLGGSFGGGSSGGSGGGPLRSGGFGCGGMGIIAIVLVFTLLRSCFSGATGLLGGGSQGTDAYVPTTAAPAPTSPSQGGSSGGSLFDLGGYQDYGSSSSSGGMDLNKIGRAHV